MKSLNFPELNQAIQEGKEFRFSGKFQTKTHIFVAVLFVFFIWYLIGNTISVLEDADLLGTLFTSIELIIPYFLISCYFAVIVWHYWNIYQRSLIINSNEIQFLFKEKIKESFNWEEIVSISKIHKSIFSSHEIEEGEKWNTIILRMKSGDKYTIKPKSLKKGDLLKGSPKRKMFFLLTSYHSR